MYFFVMIENIWGFINCFLVSWTTQLYLISLLLFSPWMPSVVTWPQTILSFVQVRSPAISQLLFLPSQDLYSCLEIAKVEAKTLKKQELIMRIPTNPFLYSSLIHLTRSLFALGSLCALSLQITGELTYLELIRLEFLWCSNRCPLNLLHSCKMSALLYGTTIIFLWRLGQLPQRNPFVRLLYQFFDNDFAFTV